MNTEQARQWLERVLRSILQEFHAHPRRQFALAGVVVVVLVAITGGTIMLAGVGGTPSRHLPLRAPALAPSKDGTIFSITTTGTQARFSIDEVLVGQPNTVVGVTNQVAGQILVDTQNPSQCKVGEIVVDLSTLNTLNGMRNRTLWDNILETTKPADQFATFAPSQITGLPSSGAIGQQVAFAITGTLTIHHVARRETFQAQVTLVNPTLLRGTVQTTVRYEDFGISVPKPPMVAKVFDPVVLSLAFTARA